MTRGNSRGLFVLLADEMSSYHDIELCSFSGIRSEQFQRLRKLVQTRSSAAAAPVALESLDDVVYILAYDGSGGALWVDNAAVRKDAFGDDLINDLYFDLGGAGA